MVTPDQLDRLAAAFGTLGKLHRQAPTAREIAALRGLWPQWPLPDTPSAQSGLSELSKSAELGETAEQIAADHNRVYGDAGRALVAPYESVHTGVEGLVFDEATMSVREAYAGLNLVAPNLNREPDDHIGLEFDFVAQAFTMALDALAGGRTDDAARFVAVARGFLRDHLQQWAPGALAKMAAAARTRFVAGVAMLSLGVLESGRDAFQTAER